MRVRPSALALALVLVLAAGAACRPDGAEEDAATAADSATGAPLPGTAAPGDTIGTAADPAAVGPGRAAQPAGAGAGARDTTAAARPPR